MKKIQYYSRVFKMLCYIAFIGMPVILIAFWLNPFGMGGDISQSMWYLFSNLPISAGVAMQKWELSTRLYAIVINFIPLGFNMAIAYSLAKLFNCYQHGQIFAERNARYIRLIGRLMLAKALIIPTIYQALITVDLTWHNPPGQRLMNMSLNISNIVIAIIVIMISWIMLEAAKLKLEQEYTV
ncbi:MAG: DUF2975 domain-containing protein [Gammaproteobacteria bacterium]|nr:DUF2975 domain-containing protein [Gammaproteobacteria bacterium]